MLAVFKARKEVLEFVDLGDGNDNIILAYYCKSKILAKKLLRSIEQRKVLTPLRDKRPSSLTIKIHKKRSVSVFLRARNYTLSPGLQNLSLGHCAI
jgi:23S rRNA A2030 N6-methylase RlmJ